MTVHPIEVAALPQFPANNVWEIPPDGVSYEGLRRGVILRRPDAHPIWHDYMCHVTHLRPREGFPPAHLEHADSTHEIVVMALNPDADNQPNKFAVLTPPNLVYQLRNLSDFQAESLFDQFIGMLSSRQLSPDTDFRSFQKLVLARLNVDALAAS